MDSQMTWLLVAQLLQSTSQHRWHYETCLRCGLRRFVVRQMRFSPLEEKKPLFRTRYIRKSDSKTFEEPGLCPIGP